jgi:hypothetical protein
VSGRRARRDGFAELYRWLVSMREIRLRFDRQMSRFEALER